MDVAIHELKAKLSAYLKRASAGELIRVTDRGKPIAVLGPAVDVVHLDASVEAGWLTPASAAGLGAVRRHRSSSTVEQALCEDSAD